MRNNILFCVIVLLLLTLPAHAVDSEHAPKKGFALLELFASEGCGSCPAADALLTKILKKASKEHLPIHALSFHVDYWNYLGWKDRFSSPIYTERQGQYVYVLKAKNSYTPQMVINGQKECVGSDEKMVWGYINGFLAQPFSVNVKLDLTHEGISKVKVRYHVDPVVEGASINLALVERDVKSHPNAGENDGQLLEQDNVVVNFQTIALAQPQGEVSFDLPSGIDPYKFSVIAFVQKMDDLKILTANSVDI